MIREALTWIVTPCTPHARWRGHLAAAIALQSRAERCRAAWQNHIDRCHDAVRESLSHCRRRRSALILGSGLALEYPLAELAAQFRRVILADIVHLWPVRRFVSRHANVELLACDLVTGLPAVADVDWVLSANLLSQLSLIPAARLHHHDDHAREVYGHRIMAHHLDALTAIDAERCLIADAEQTVRNRYGEIIEHADYAAAFGLDRHAFAHWDWILAPPGELPRGLTASHRMVACRWPSSDVL